MKRLVSIFAVSLLALCAGSCFSYTESVYEIHLFAGQMSGMGSRESESYNLYVQVEEKLALFSTAHDFTWVAEDCRKSDNDAVSKFEAALADLKALEKEINTMISSVSDVSFRFTLSYTLKCTSYREQERVLGEYTMSFSN